MNVPILDPNRDGGMINPPPSAERQAWIERFRSGRPRLAERPDLLEVVLNASAALDAVVTTKTFGEVEMWDIRFDYARMERILSIVVSLVPPSPSLEITSAVLWTDFDEQRIGRKMYAWTNRTRTRRVTLAASVTKEEFAKALEDAVSEVKSLGFADMNEAPLGPP